MGQEMDNNTTIKNDDTIETSNGASEKEKFRKLTICKFPLRGFYPSPKSFWSCTHVNSYPNYTLYIIYMFH